MNTEINPFERIFNRRERRLANPTEICDDCNREFATSTMNRCDLRDFRDTRRILRVIFICESCFATSEMNPRAN